MMDWNNLLCHERLERPYDPVEDGRSPFQKDIDRVVFSSAFRRLANKTQVHPLSRNDHVRTRLTHSIEVSSVGRSLGTNVGKRIEEKPFGGKIVSSEAIGYIVQAACLAHDIGNPPFGHSGEKAISEWFQSYFNRKGDIWILKTLGEKVNDFTNFEGNAQGFRIITQLENNSFAGGLQLTYAVLGTFLKYPRLSGENFSSNVYVGHKKFCFFRSEARYLEKIGVKLGLIRKEAGWCRHPLAFLVEAADDICYGIVDIEDGFELGYLSFRDALEILKPIAGEAGEKVIAGGKLNDLQKIAKLRAISIGRVIDSVTDAFIKHQKHILSGEFSEPLLNYTPYGLDIDEAKKVAKEKIYQSPSKTRIELSGYEIISGLLECFVPVIEELERVCWRTSSLSSKSQKYMRIIGSDSLFGAKTIYDALLRVTDFVSGMSDRYALDTYRHLKGISLQI